MLACALCVGSSPEPYLEATLASIAPVVDLLVVNDNSDGTTAENIATIERSAFARDGRLSIVRTRFVDFATMRNDAYAALRARARPDWVLWLDADEVHTEQIAGLVRFLLPRLGPEYAAVDGYTDHFIGSFRWISDVARRFCAYRFHPELRWEGAVHEKIEGMRGKSFVVPYRFAHYGNVLPPALYAAKDLRYLALGNTVDYSPPQIADATIENIYARKGLRARRFRGVHPAAARPVVARLEREWNETLARVDRLFADGQTPGDRTRNAAQGAVEELRIALRRLEHPGAWPPRAPR